MKMTAAEIEAMKAQFPACLARRDDGKYRREGIFAEGRKWMILTMHNRGHSDTEISNALGMDRTTAYYFIQKYTLDDAISPDDIRKAYEIVTEAAKLGAFDHNRRGNLARVNNACDIRKGVYSRLRAMGMTGRSIGIMCGVRSASNIIVSAKTPQIQATSA